MYRLTDQDLCLWEAPPLIQKLRPTPDIGRPRIILISSGELLATPYFGRSAYILISDILIYGGQCCSLSFWWFKFETELQSRHAMPVGVFPHGDIVSVFYFI